MSTQQIQDDKNYVVKGELLNEIGHAFSEDNQYDIPLFINDIPNAIKDLQYHKIEAENEKNQALEDKEIAENARDQALQDKAEAENARDQALEEKTEAENEKNQALKDKEIAESAFYATLVRRDMIPEHQLALAASTIGVETVTFIEGEENYSYALKSSKPVTEINISGKLVKALNIYKADDLNKIICYNNQLTELDLSNCPNLQYLHMFNNPICDNNDYLNNLVNCINSLPNRTDKVCGSIVYSPWHDLPVLCTTITQWLGNTIPNPFNGAITSRDLIYKYPNREGYGTANLIKNQIYGNVPMPEYDEVKSVTVQGMTAMERTTFIEGNIRYARYNGSTFIRDEETVALERHQNLRKALEIGEQKFSYITDTSKTKWPMPEQEFTIKTPFEGTLFKNWMFGSAIQYDANALKEIPQYFKKLHILDFWESAEYGFGAKIGILDQFKDPQSQQAPYPTIWKNWSIQLNADYGRINPENQDTLFTHGVGISVLLCGRGDEASSFGIAPQATLLPAHPYDDNNKKYISANDFLSNYISFLSENANCCTLSWEMIDESTEESVANNPDWINFCEKNFVCNSAGNRGLGSQYIMMEPTHYSVYGNSAFYVTSLDTDSSYSPYSSTSNVAIKERKLFSMYGTTYLRLNTDIYKILGTSMATPITAAYLCLLRNIYNKILNLNTDDNNYGMNSNFIKYVQNHWTQWPKNAMNSTTTLGMPNIFGTEILDHQQTKIKNSNEMVTLEDSIADDLDNVTTWTQHFVFTPSNLTSDGSSENKLARLTRQNKTIMTNTATPKTLTPTQKTNITNCVICNNIDNLSLYLSNLNANDHSAYPTEWVENTTYTLDGGSSRWTYSWLFFADKDKTNSMTSAVAFEGLAQLHNLNYEPQEKIILTIVCIDGIKLDFYWNNTKIKTWYSDFDTIVEPFNATSNVNRYQYNKELTEQEIYNNVINLLNS